jgi:hypothetical protein
MRRRNLARPQAFDRFNEASFRNVVPALLFACGAILISSGLTADATTG